MTEPAQVVALDDVEIGGARRRVPRPGALVPDIAAEHVGDGRAETAALTPDVDAREVVGVEVELHSLATEGGVDLVLDASQRDLRGAGDGTDLRPAEGLRDGFWVRAPRLGGPGESGSRALPALGMDAELQTRSTQATNQSLSCWKLSMCPTVASVRKDSRMNLNALPTLPLPAGWPGREWTRRMPSTAHVRSRAAFE